MIRFVFIFSLLSVLPVAVCGQQNWAAFELKGQVKSVRQQEYAVLGDGKGGMIKAGVDVMIEFEFAPNGQLIGWGDFYLSGSPNWFYRIEYNEAGQRTVQKNYIPPEHVINSMEYTYDEAQRETGFKFYTADHELVYSWVHTYGKKNQISQSSSYDVSNQLTHYIRYSYKKGFKISEATYAKNDSLISQVSYTYEKGLKQPVRCERRNGSGELEQYWFSSYSDSGQPLVYKEFRKDTLYLSIQYEYDTLQNIRYKRYCDVLDTVVAIDSFRYVYDPRGNWVSREFYKNGMPTRLTERQLIYFE